MSLPKRMACRQEILNPSASTGEAETEAIYERHNRRGKVALKGEKEDN